MGMGILGRKLGMTQVFTDEGLVIPVTLIEAGPCTVVAKRTVENDGYQALQLGFGEKPEKKTNKPLRGHYKKAGVKPARYLREVRVDDAGAYEVGQEIKCDIFSPGQKVDVVGTTKGRGFAGSIKRHGFHRGPMAHGSKYHRRPGALAALGPSRVFKGRKLPGRYGGERVTVQNLEVVKVDPERNLLAVKGSIPGPKNSLVLVKEAVKGQ
ncbi:MAG: 50S ribosomal protein L3 [Peptococcaceae bacterium]|nr:50S ribosomal protein L3 [Peptococcaceae bacterium]